MSALETSAIWGAEEGLDPEILLMSNDELRQRIRLLDNDIRIMRSDIQRINHESHAQRERIKENNEKVKLNKQLPYLVGNVVEILDLADDDDDEQDGAATDVDAQRRGKSAVIKTSTRQTIFLPIPGLVNSEELVPNDLVGTNKDSYLILEKLPAEYDSRVKAMEVDEKPTEEYSDIGGLDKQIEELVEAVVLPMTHKEKFDAIGIQPPKGVLLHGPPGTGKTLLARACAKQTDAIFLKLAAPQLVQMFIGDGAKLVRDAFELAKEKCKDEKRGGAIIFIDELDAIGTKRFGGEQSGDREVQRTMLELLNQLDGFTSNTNIKVIAATNRPDVLDPALLRSGRLDRKIELPHPTEEARARILQIHSRKMNVDKDETNFDELARSTEDFNGAQLKAVCVEAGMLALRRDSTVITHEDFMEGISVVSAKKKVSIFSGTGRFQPHEVNRFEQERSTGAMLGNKMIPEEPLVSAGPEPISEEKAKQAVVVPIRKSSSRLLQLFETKNSNEAELDLDSFYASRLRRRTRMEQEITGTLVAGGLLKEEHVCAPHHTVDPSKSRGICMTLSPGEEYENYKKVDAAISKLNSPPFFMTPTVAEDDHVEGENEKPRKKTAAGSKLEHDASGVNAAALIQPTIPPFPGSPDRRRSSVDTIKALFTKPQQALSSKKMFNPHSRFRLAWDVTSILFIFYNAITLPFNASFSASDNSDFFDTFLDVYFLVDIILTFNTAVEMDGSVKYSRRLAATTYLTSWFLIDLIAALPYAYLVPSSHGSSQVSLQKILKLLRLIRLLRMFRVSRIFRRISNTVFIRSTMSSLMKYCLIVVLISHWFGCIFHAITLGNKDGKNWVTVQKLQDPYGDKWDRYVAAIYFAVMTVATIGFGDVSGTNPDERLFSIFAMIIGGGVFAYGITNIVELVSSLTVKETRFREKMDEVNEYMQARELPLKLRAEIREFYHNTRLSRESKLNSEQQILNDLSSKLRSKIALSINDQFLRKFPFFTGSDPNFLMELALNVRMIHFAPLEDVIIEGEIGHEMFFIFRGAVEVRRQNVQIGILGENQYFGEMAILSPDNKRTATVRTLCFCELRMLSRNRFLEALACFPAMQTKMAQVAQNRAVTDASKPATPSPAQRGSAALKVVVAAKNSVTPLSKKPPLVPSESKRVLMGAAISRIQLVDERSANGFIPGRSTTSSRLNSSVHRKSMAGGNNISASMVAMISETATILEESNRRQDLLIKRVLRLQSDLNSLSSMREKSSD